MFTRRRREQRNAEAEKAATAGGTIATSAPQSNSNYNDGASTIAGNEDESVMGGMSFMGGVSLDGQSVLLPGDPGYVEPTNDFLSMGGGSAPPSRLHEDMRPDDVSSINDSMYGSMFGSSLPSGAVMSGLAMTNGYMTEDEEPSAAPAPHQRVVDTTPFDDEPPDSRSMYSDKLESPPSRRERAPKDEEAAMVAVLAAQDKEDQKGAGGGGCLPRWLSSAPLWLQAVIVLSVALLIGAMVLISVAAAMEAQDGNTSTSSFSGAGSSSSPSTPPPTTSGFPPTPPTPSPVAQTALPSKAPTPSPTVAPSSSPEPTFTGETRPPTSEPTSAPTGTPTKTLVPSTTPSIPTMPPTSTPTLAIDQTATVLYLTGGRPLGMNRTLFEEHLDELPVLGYDPFLVHLGDFGSPRDYNCSEYQYDDVATLFNKSSVPVYFVPGDNEYNDCDVIGPDAAWDLWREYLLRYDLRWGDTTYTVDRQTPRYPENFAFVSKQVLYIGLNIVGGTNATVSAADWSARLEADLKWINDQFFKVEGSIEMMTIFAHSDPRITINKAFFDAFKVSVETDYATVTVILCHRNLSSDTSNVITPYAGVSNYVVVTVQGSTWPPMRLEIDATEGYISWNQGNWWNELQELPAEFEGRAGVVEVGV